MWKVDFLGWFSLFDQNIPYKMDKQAPGNSELNRIEKNFYECKHCVALRAHCVCLYVLPFELFVKKFIFNLKCIHTYSPNTDKCRTKPLWFDFQKDSVDLITKCCCTGALSLYPDGKVSTRPTFICIFIRKTTK